MTAALMTRAGLPGELRSNGYVLPADLSIEEWGRVLRLVDHIAAASPWWLVDTVVYGEDRFAEDHSQMLPGPDEDPYGISQARIKQAGWMGRVYPPGTRVPDASYTHHRVVADLPPIERQKLLVEVASAQKTDHPIATRTLAKRATEIRKVIEGHAVTVDGAPLPGDDLEWVPTKDQLVDAARAALEIRLSEMSSGRRGSFEAGALWAWLYAQNLDLFKREGE